MKNLFKPRKFILTKNQIIIVVLASIIVTSSFIAIDYRQSIKEKVEVNNQAAETQLKAVKIMKLNAQSYNILPSEIDNLFLKVVGSVKADASVDIIALTKGTVVTDNFEIGDQVQAGQVLANLQNNVLSVNYSNSQLRVSNALNNIQTLFRLAGESVRQAELGLENSQKSIQTAKIGLQTAKDNLIDAKNLQTETDLSNRQTAVISFRGYLNLINASLKQINYIIKAEGSDQLPGIASVLSAKDSQALIMAKENYWQAKRLYNNLLDLNLNSENILIRLIQMSKLLDKTRLAVSSLIDVLDKTVVSTDLSQSQLSFQRSSFLVLHTQIVNFQTAVENTLQLLTSNKIINQREINILTKTVETNKAQLAMAEIGRAQAEVALVKAQQSQEQQSAVNKATLDSAQGQLNLVGVQLADLNIKAPISGQITTKYIELGQEMQVGKLIAQISQSKAVKIEVNLPAEDVYKVELGQSVLINNSLIGVVTLISPSANPITKKVKLEILFDNENQDLIVGTFVEVMIPIEKLSLKVASDFMLVPLKAVTITQNESFAFIMKNGTALKILLELGQVQGSMIEVKGLHDGDDLIINGNKDLKDGVKIKNN